MNFLRKRKPLGGADISLVNKFRKVSDQEILRWVDNTHTGLGMNIQELRKNLGTHDTALIYVADIVTGTEALQAAMFVLKERRISDSFQ